MGMAKADLVGNIIYTNKIKPTISYEFIPPPPINNFDFPTHVQSSEKNFTAFYGFNNDKYIINISGYIYDWYDYKIGWGDREIEFDISIFYADNLNELLDEKHYEDLEYIKITDNLFKFVLNERSFYYNEKDNKIEYIDDIFNYIGKCFSCKEKNQLKEINENAKKQNYNVHSIYKNSNSNSFKYFFLDDNIFSIFDGKFYLYVINLSNNNNIVRRIKINWIRDEYINLEIKNIIYSKLDKKEYLYISFAYKDKNTKKIINKLILGIIV